MYCSQQHRAAARKMRLEGRTPGGAGHDKLPVSNKTKAGGRSAKEGASGGRRPSRGGVRRLGTTALWGRALFHLIRRRIGGGRLPGLTRSAVLLTGVLAIAGAMLAGDGFGARLSTDEPPPTPVAASWPTQAKQTLKTVKKHLAGVRKAERALAAVPPDQRTKKVRTLARKLAKRKAELRRQRASLRVDLAAVRMHKKTTKDLRAVQRQVGLVNQALRSLRRLPDDARRDIKGELRGLSGRVNKLTRQANLLRRNSQTWGTTVEVAGRKAIPQPPATTLGLVDEIIRAATPQKPEPAKPEPKKPEPKKPEPKKPEPKKPEPKKPEPKKPEPKKPERPAKPSPKDCVEPKGKRLPEKCARPERKRPPKVCMLPGWKRPGDCAPPERERPPKDCGLRPTWKRPEHCAPPKPAPPPRYCEPPKHEGRDRPRSVVPLLPKPKPRPPDGEGAQPESRSGGSPEHGRDHEDPKRSSDHRQSPERQKDDGVLRVLRPG